MKKFILTVLLTLIALNNGNSYSKTKNLSKVEDSKTSQTNIISTMLKVQISGAVKKPGVYQVPDGSRVADVISKAGGLKKDAVVKDLNLTTTVTDATKIHITSKSELDTQKKEEAKNLNSKEIKNEKNIVSYTYNIKEKSKTSKSYNGIFNINTASEEDLDSLPGIGKKIAKSIIDYRTKNKGFKSLDELTNIDGIGEKKLKKLKARLKV